MFSRRILGGQPDSYRLQLGYRVGFACSREDDDAGQQEESSVLDETVTVVDWTDGDAEASVRQRLQEASVSPALVEETVHVALQAIDPEDVQRGSYILCAADPNREVQLDLEVRRTAPRLKSLELQRLTATGAVAAPFMVAVLKDCQLECVSRLKCTEGLAHVFEPDLMPRWRTLQQLNLSGCGLSTLSGCVGQLQVLRALLLSNNRLASLPNELGSLSGLQVLAADNNLLTSIPVALKQCRSLHEVSLENNKLTTPIIDLSGLKQLRALHLYGNPLQFLPELTPCAELRHLSLANVRITSDVNYSQWQVEVASGYTMARVHNLQPLFSLIFRRSSCQHPLLAGALGRIAEDPANCELIWKEEKAIQQLVLMAMSNNDIVIQQACKTIGLLAKHNLTIIDEIINCDVMSACLTLISSTRHAWQLAGMRVVADLAFASEAASERLLTERLLDAMQGVMGSGSDDVRAVALEALGNLAFCPANRDLLYGANGIKQRAIRCALAAPGTSKHIVKAAAIRALAILGENEVVREAVNMAPISGRGLRILCMDGGGMRGIATVRMLREIESRTGRRIADLFDLICGTSTGGILAVALAIKDFNLDECDDIYRTLGNKVFSKPVSNDRDKETWRESLYRVYKSGQQHVRVAVYGAKHDTVVFESLLKHYCTMPHDSHCVSDLMIDTSVLGVPKCFVVSTLASVTPAVPFVFRNYEYPPGTQELVNEIKCCPGSSKHRVWQAVRASSAAPYYLDDYSCGNERFQDGAATANNPAVIAIQEARALWPDLPIDCITSIGCGSTPLQPRERSMSAYFETGNVLIESACSVERTDQALSTLLPLIPNIKYFRFNPVDVRCNVELDDIDPGILAALEEATVDYVLAAAHQFDEVARVLTSGRPQQQEGADGVGIRYEPQAFGNRLGVRRGVLLLECPRGLTHVARTHVEEVAALVEGMEQCVATIALGTTGSSSSSTIASAAVPSSSPPSAAASPSGWKGNGGGESGGGSSASVFEDVASGYNHPHYQHHLGPDSCEFTTLSGAALSELCGQLGVVHLALHADESSAGRLVTRWRSELQAIAEPSVEAGSVLALGGCDPERESLSDLMARRPVFTAGGRVFNFVNRTSQWVGPQQVSTFLLQSVVPDAHLTANQVGSVQGSWRQLLVVSSARLPEPVIQALLEHGAKGVVCAHDPGFNPPRAAAASFFSVFYRVLLDGDSIPSALAAAYGEVPDLRDRYVWYNSKDGRFLMHTVSRTEGHQRYESRISRHWSWRSGEDLPGAAGGPSSNKGSGGGIPVAHEAASATPSP